VIWAWLSHKMVQASMHYENILVLADRARFSELITSRIFPRFCGEKCATGTNTMISKLIRTSRMFPNEKRGKFENVGCAICGLRFLMILVILVHVVQTQ
jgi:hypothetical protein